MELLAEAIAIGISRSARNDIGLGLCKMQLTDTDNGQNDKLDDEQKAIRELERETLRSKVGDLNRCAYKLVLRSMYQELNVTVEDKELNQLVDLRNQIIHNGSPDYEKWGSPSEDGEAVSKFCGLLLERSLMAILHYRGNFNRYDQLSFS